MNNLSQNSKSAVTELAQIIPGYSGYQEQGERKPNDQRFRDHLVSRTEFIIKGLRDFSDRLDHKGHSKLVTQVQKLQASLETITHSLKEPAYANTSFFELKEVKPEDLEQIYNYELSLQQQIKILTEEVQELNNADFGVDDLGDYFAHLADVIDGFNQALIEREFLLMSCE